MALVEGTICFGCPAIRCVQPHKRLEHDARRVIISPAGTFQSRQAIEECQGMVDDAYEHAMYRLIGLILSHHALKTHNLGFST